MMVVAAASPVRSAGLRVHELTLAQEQVARLLVEAQR